MATIEWQADQKVHRAWARTEFASFRIFPNMNMAFVEDITHARWTARVETINGAGLASRSDFSTISAGQSWCEGEYRRLLEAELKEKLGLEDLIRQINLLGWLVDLLQHANNEWEAIPHRHIASPLFNKDQPPGVLGISPQEALEGLRADLASLS